MIRNVGGSTNMDPKVRKLKKKIFPYDPIMNPKSNNVRALADNEAMSDYNVKLKVLQDLIKGDMDKRKDLMAAMNLPEVKEEVSPLIPEEKAMANLDEALTNDYEEYKRKYF